MSMCPDCGGPKYRYAKFCKLCSARGERNPNYGKPRPQHVKDAISKAQLGVPDPKRGVGKPSSPHIGRGQACRLYVKPKTCEDCGLEKRLDWHHIDNDATNNERTNLAALCRRCHQIRDGRHEFLRTQMPSMGGKAVHGL